MQILKAGLIKQVDCHIGHKKNNQQIRKYDVTQFRWVTDGQRQLLEIHSNLKIVIGACRIEMFEISSLKSSYIDFYIR